jgi:acyl-CoA dehydrogenase
VSTEADLLAEVAEAILGKACPPSVVLDAERGSWPADTWEALAQAGLPWIGIPEAKGGSGGDLVAACAMLHGAGRFAVPLPLVETALIGGWALAAAHLPVPAHAITASTHPLRLRRHGGDWALDGTLPRVPWGRHVTQVVALAVDDEQRTFVVAPEVSAAELTEGCNLAAEPRDALRFDGSPIDAEQLGAAPRDVTADAMLQRGALGRAAQMAGAMGRIRDLTVRYTAERQQFGRPIARFQAVQSLVVQVAEDALVADAAVRTAAERGLPASALFDVAAAKVLAGQSGTSAAAAAHQAHGAIGMTREYELGILTRRLWAWREEYGGEAYWARLLGDSLLDAGPSAVWSQIAG